MELLNNNKLETKNNTLLEGIKVGDTVEINCYGDVSRGSIVSFGEDIIEVATDSNKKKRIKINAISSIETYVPAASGPSMDPNMDAVEERPAKKDLTETDKKKHFTFLPESETSQKIKILGKIDLSQLPQKNNKETISLSTPPLEANSPKVIANHEVMLPSMGKLKRKGPMFGFIATDQGEDLYFSHAELVSYYGILDEPSVGDDVIFSLDKNSKGVVAKCVHKQCSRDTMEELIEKMQSLSHPFYTRLRHQLENFEKQTGKIEDETTNLYHFFKRAGLAQLKEDYNPNNVERAFAERLTQEEYIKAINLLIDETVKKDPSKSYNLFLRSSSYARSHGMFDDAEKIIEKALDIFSDVHKIKGYFNTLLKQIVNLRQRFRVTEEIVTKNLEVLNEHFPSMPSYVKDAILSYKDFNGITRDKAAVQTGWYKKEYIEELKEKIKQNNADDSLCLTLMKLEIALAPKSYNPISDMSHFLVNRAKKLLALGNRQKYSEVRYLLRLSFRFKTFELGFDNTVGLFIMTLGNYSPTDIDMYMRGEGTDYKLGNLWNSIDLCEETTLELALLSISNEKIKSRIIKWYEEKGEDVNNIELLIKEIHDLKLYYTQYTDDPLNNFPSFISYIDKLPVLLKVEKDFVSNDAIKILPRVADFNQDNNYEKIRNAFKSAKDMVDKGIATLLTQPTEVGYEIILPAFRLLADKIAAEFTDLEKRAVPDISTTILQPIELIDRNTASLNIEVQHSTESARNIYLRTIKISGEDLCCSKEELIESNLSAGEEKLINIKLSINDKSIQEKAAEFKYEIEYDDIFIATDKRVLRSKEGTKTINLDDTIFEEIDNKFAMSSGGQELDADDPMFFGRKNIIERLHNQILAGKNNQIAIYGQKRSGKSSLLNRIKSKLMKETSCPVICGKFSLQGLSEEEENPERWILKSVAEALIAARREFGLGDISKQDVASFFENKTDPFSALIDFIEKCNDTNKKDGYQNAHLVVLIDEFTYLYQLIKEGRICKDFMRRWKALIETPGINLQTIIAAQDTLPHFMRESYASNSFNIFSKEPLSYLSKDEALQLIREPVKDVVRYHRHSDEKIYDYTAGSPFFTQIFCSQLVKYLNERKNHTVGSDEIQAVAKNLCTGKNRLEDGVFECLINEADGSYYNNKENKIVLKEIAMRTRVGGYVCVEDLHTEMPKQRLYEVLNNLLTRNVISKNGDGYTINVKLFSQWIQNN